MLSLHQQADTMSEGACMLCLQASDGAGSAAISDLPMDEFKTASALLSMIDEQGVLDMEGMG